VACVIDQRPSQAKTLRPSHQNALQKVLQGFSITLDYTSKLYWGKSVDNTSYMYSNTTYDALELSSVAVRLFISTSFLKETVTIKWNATSPDKTNIIMIIPTKGATIEKIVNPYDAFWNPSSLFSRVVAKPTCIAVSTIVIYTDTTSSQAKLRWTNVE
jgi:hypothetical protein